MRRKALALDPSDLLGEPRMLDMSLKSGNLEMTLESDYQKIFHLCVTVWDDWSQMSPHLVSYGSRFLANLDAQREGAARELKAFQIAQSPKLDDPLSAFTNAMLQTAWTRLHEKEDSLSYVVQQRMQFSLGSLRLVVFPQTMEDNEMASFTASDLRSDLDLIVESSNLDGRLSWLEPLAQRKLAENLAQARLHLRADKVGSHGSGSGWLGLNEPRNTTQEVRDLMVDKLFGKEGFPDA
ncbi:hypothetical protein EDB89DRAFT_2162203 [Lactarius sanguifluus]|nr:hypothetical protein EDB89DRAFT_2162203 [Lactarius sanguifluus]